MNIHTLYVVGRATKAPEILESKAGKKYAKFSIAVNDKKKDSEDEVTYYDILVFEKQAETASEMIQKGDFVLAIGKPDYNSYISKDENPKTSISFIPQFWQVLK